MKKFIVEKIIYQTSKNKVLIKWKGYKKPTETNLKMFIEDQPVLWKEYKKRIKKLEKIAIKILIEFNITY
jgi:hypothetical protein